MWTIRFTKTEWLDPLGDALPLLVSYEKVLTERIDEQDEGDHTTTGSIRVLISRNVRKNWDLDEPDLRLEAQAVQYAWEYACKEAKAGRLDGSVDLELNSYNTSDQPHPISLEEYYIPWSIDCDEL